MFNRNKRSKMTREARLAYVFVLPAAILIGAIAIWPVLRSMWISLYDVRLNDPTRSEVHSTYALDMERYTQTLPILLRTLIEKHQPIKIWARNCNR